MSDALDIPGGAGDATPPVGAPITVSIYAESDGRILGILTCAQDQLPGNVPSGCGFIPGAHRADCRRVNLQTRKIESYQPPAPDADHVWNAADERWELPPAIVAQRADRLQARRQIDALEKQQARALREYVIGRGGSPVELKARLEAIDDQIAALRSQLG